MIIHVAVRGACPVPARELPPWNGAGPHPFAAARTGGRDRLRRHPVRGDTETTPVTRAIDGAVHRGRENGSSPGASQRMVGGQSSSRK